MQKNIVYFAFKIKDGLYIGNQRSPFEKDFIQQNKISHVINCAGTQIKINPQQFGLKVLIFNWIDSDDQVLSFIKTIKIILDEDQTNMESVYHFIEEAIYSCEGTLICSQRGQSRALTLITGYLMKKFSWSLYKSLQYMNSKRIDFEIRANFLKQLLAFEKNHFQTTYCSKEWKGIYLNKILLKDILEVGDALLLKNTYLNAQINHDIDPKNYNNTSSSNLEIYDQKIKWKDQLVIYIQDSIKEGKVTSDKPILKKTYQNKDSPNRIKDQDIQQADNNLDNESNHKLNQQDFFRKQIKGQAKSVTPEFETPQRNNNIVDQKKIKKIDIAISSFDNYVNQQDNKDLKNNKMSMFSEIKLKNDNFMELTPKFQEEEINIIQGNTRKNQSYMQNNKSSSLQKKKILITNYQIPIQLGVNKQLWREKNYSTKTTVEISQVTQQNRIMNFKQRSVTPENKYSNQIQSPVEQKALPPNQHQSELLEQYLDGGYMKVNEAKLKVKPRPRQLTPIIQQMIHKQIPQRSISSVFRFQNRDQEFQKIISMKTNQYQSFINNINPEYLNEKQKNKQFSIKVKQI